MFIKLMSFKSALKTTTTTILRLSGFCPRLSEWAGYQKDKTRKVNQSGFTGARDSEWQWHQLGHMQICTSPQTDNHTSTPPLSFYRPDALPATQPTASKHWGIKSTLKTAAFIFLVS